MGVREQYLKIHSNGKSASHTVYRWGHGHGSRHASDTPHWFETSPKHNGFLWLCCLQTLVLIIWYVPVVR